MHVSLYRKFRPDTFDKMVRQEHVVTILKNQIQSGAVGHAYLFCGPRGTGKTSIARIFARSVNCETPQNGSPCGACVTCLALAEGSLDVVEIDAASNNGVNEMRDLREKVQYPPVTGKYKVYIIDEVHMLTDSAFNALLKTLEEPPAHAIFILATTEPHKIPATILSRCMRLDFKLIPQEDLEGHLISILEQIGKPYEKEAVAAIARAGAGSDRDMLSIAEMCISYADKLTYDGVIQVLGAADFDKICALTDAIVCSDMPTALTLTEQILAEGKAVGVLCRDILQQLNGLSVTKTCQNAEKLLSLPKTHFDRMKEVASRADGRAILRATDVFAQAETQLRFVSSPRICLETAIMRATLPQQEESIDALLVRIKRLEDAIAGIPMPLSGGMQREQLAPQPSTPKRQEVDEYIPPLEEPVFEEYLQNEPTPFTEAPVVKQALPKQSPSPVTPLSATERGSAELCFGKFMRTLRKTSKNGVLFTMCSDLEAVFEGDLLVLYTQSATVYRSLSKEEHRQTMKEAFAQVGISSFEVRMKGEKAVEDKSGLEQFKKDFSQYQIEEK